MNQQQYEIYKKLLAEHMGWDKKKPKKTGLNPTFSVGKITPIDEMFDTSIGDINITLSNPSQEMTSTKDNTDNQNTLF